MTCRRSVSFGGFFHLSLGPRPGPLCARPLAMVGSSAGDFELKRLVGTERPSRGIALKMGFKFWASAMFATVAMGAMAGCSDDSLGYLGGNPRGRQNVNGSPEVAARRASNQALFNNLYGDLAASCGSCHANAVGGAPSFLDEKKPYEAITAYPGIVVADYLASKLLTAGNSTPHSGGPGLSGTLKDRVTVWLQSEAAAMIDEGLPGSDSIQVAEGTNTLTLGNDDPETSGTTITFIASTTAKSLYLTDIQLRAPGAADVAISAPRFVAMTDSGAEVPDPIDSFSNVDATAKAGGLVTLGSGSVYLSGFAPNSKLRIVYKSLKAVKATAVSTSGDCKSVATFVGSAAPQLTTLCRSCHGGANAAAANAVSMSALGTDNAKACAQVLTKINRTAPATSSLLVRPRPGSGHPAVANFNQATFDKAILDWVAKE